ncbi:MAG: HlyD family secretion protein [Methyloceanibacter sp.]
MAEKNEKTLDPVRRWTLIIFAIIVLLFLYSIIADRMTPYSSQAIVQAYVVRVAPEVSGRVLEVGVTDNQKVKAGELLFRIDPEPYAIAVKQAEAAVDGVGQKIGANTAGVASAQERLVEARAQRTNTVEQANRVLELVQKGVYAKAREDRAKAEIEAAEATVREAEAELVKAKEQLGPQGADNPELREAVAALEKAKLDLLRTSIISPSDGVVTNLQLTLGQFAAVGQSVLTFIDARDVWFSANFRENTLESIAADAPVEIVLDVFPGRVFDGKVENVGWGVAQGAVDPATGLPKISAPVGLTRTPQRFPVRINLDQKDYLPGMRLGSQANVIVYATGNPITNVIGALWIRLIALLTYVS